MAVANANLVDIHERILGSSSTFLCGCYVPVCEVLKNLEGLKLSQINQTPVIQVLDMPKYPLVNQTYHWIIYLLGGMLAGVLIGVFFAIYLYTETLQ